MRSLFIYFLATYVSLTRSAPTISHKDINTLSRRTSPDTAGSDPEANRDLKTILPHDYPGLISNSGARGPYSVTPPKRTLNPMAADSMDSVRSGIWNVASIDLKQNIGLEYPRESRTAFASPDQGPYLAFFYYGAPERKDPALPKGVALIPAIPPPNYDADEYKADNDADETERFFYSLTDEHLGALQIYTYEPQRASLPGQPISTVERVTNLREHVDYGMAGEFSKRTVVRNLATFRQFVGAVDAQLAATNGDGADWSGLIKRELASTQNYENGLLYKWD